MNLLTIEVEISHGVVTPKEPHLLPEKGTGLLTVLSDKPEVSARPARVLLPLIPHQPGVVINPEKGDLDASLWD